MGFLFSINQGIDEVVYAFIHIPKSAGSTLRHILRCSFGANHCDIKSPPKTRTGHRWLDASDLSRAKRVYPSLAGIAGHRVTPFAGLHDAGDEIRYFTFLRDPVKRFMSNFQHVCRDDGVTPDRDALLAFCEDPWRHSVQTRWLAGSLHASEAMAQLEQRVGFVGITERFDESLLLFEQWLADPRLATAFTSKNIATKPPGPSLLEQADLLARVEAVNAADIELYAFAMQRFDALIAAQGDGFAAKLEAFQVANASTQPKAEPSWAKLKRNLIYKPALHVAR